jgi:hypothetical protein
MERRSLFSVFQVGALDTRPLFGRVAISHWLKSANLIIGAWRRRGGQPKDNTKTCRRLHLFCFWLETKERPLITMTHLFTRFLHIQITSRGHVAQSQVPFNDASPLANQSDLQVSRSHKYLRCIFIYTSKWPQNFLFPKITALPRSYLLPSKSNEWRAYRPRIKVVAWNSFNSDGSIPAGQLIGSDL